MAKVTQASLVGGKVKLARDVERRDGLVFKQGVVMTVDGSDRGGLWLYCYVRGWRETIHGLKLEDVIVVEMPKKEDGETK